MSLHEDEGDSQGGSADVCRSEPGVSGHRRDAGKVRAGSPGIALTLCPISAALFFGSLIPVAVKFESAVLLPSVYGAATGLPVLVFAVIIALGAKSVGTAYDRMAAFEKWARRVTGVIFIAVGIYYCLTYIFGVFS